MSKIKNLMEKMSSEIKELGKKFPLTMVLIAFVTILFTIAIDQDFSRNTEEILEKIYLFCIIWGIGTIFTEIFFVKKSNKILGYGLTGGISFIFTKILTANMTQNTNQIATTNARNTTTPTIINAIVPPLIFTSYIIILT